MPPRRENEKEIGLRDLGALWRCKMLVGAQEPSWPRTNPMGRIQSVETNEAIVLLWRWELPPRKEDGDGGDGGDGGDDGGEEDARQMWTKLYLVLFSVDFDFAVK